MTLSKSFYKQHEKNLFLLEQVFPNTREKTTNIFSNIFRESQYYIIKSKSKSDWMEKSYLILFILCLSRMPTLAIRYCHLFTKISALFSSIEKNTF